MEDLWGRGKRNGKGKEVRQEGGEERVNGR